MGIRVSVYIRTGERAAVSYYRFYQYFNRVENVNFKYNHMITDKFHDKYTPIRQQPIYIKIFLMVVVLWRVGWQLTVDLFSRPDILILSRRFTNRAMPFYFVWILKNIKRRGTKFYWDFDDNIIESRELSRKNFDILSGLADKIVVASPYLCNLISQENRDKVTFMPTTDGDMYERHDEMVDKQRLKSLDDEVRIVWVGTSVSLRFLPAVCEKFENLAMDLKAQSKRLIFTVVCDKPLVYDASNFELRNIKWERERAIEEMLKAHIGIMPLESNDFTKCKGGFKLIQYLSVGLPVVVSDVGINSDIVDENCGFLIDKLSSERWSSSILGVVKDKSLWLEYSRNAKQKWLRDFSVIRNLSFWNSVIK